ncbi:citrate/2-methylcitrate synthase [Clostridium estertheticum]|uniref:citrate/2-methylcitrate synthase n=2 Tax=Clostridium estertheticum TaxID=238834 RepID=UPI001C7CC686|nr:citrate/2-methylcitrate synthase [Clostridium estertheticum]MBX4261116.1 citrate/2-methylcitrate synthase [Clostridium estertheticum]WLC71946.1 citrate/2-methylcitrate synthase [Clostridium estertheticum]
MDNKKLIQFKKTIPKKLSSFIDPELFVKFEVKRGLRDIDGRGVLVGLTEISQVNSSIVKNNKTIPTPGVLKYRGINIESLVDGFLKDGRLGFEETCYLLLFSDLPSKGELKNFTDLLSKYRNLPDDFVRDMILKMPSKNIMNSLARSILALYSIDDKAEDTSPSNVLEQCMRLIACFPLMVVYGYQALSHYHNNNNLIIRSPLDDLSTAENILYMLRDDSKYTKLEATILDLALVLHAEHGGGNNSTFVTHVITSSGSDTYSVIAAALGSLKGPRHGGANIKVVQMFEDMKEKVSDWKDDAEIEKYLLKILTKEAFDKSGLIYGMGHAVYSISDPRAVIFKKYVGRLAKAKGLEDEYNLYARVEELAPIVIASVRKIYKGVSANVDFYSGFVYRMLGIPDEMFTPIFAVARIAGWSAHRLEEIINNGKIIRPAYKCVAGSSTYVPLNDRK